MSTLGGVLACDCCLGPMACPAVIDAGDLELCGECVGLVCRVCGVLCPQDDRLAAQGGVAHFACLAKPSIEMGLRSSLAARRAINGDRSTKL